MKHVLILFILLCFGHVSLARGNPDSKAPEKTDPASSNEETTHSEKEPTPLIWPKPFKPSEEIGADSQISFPTDI